MPLEMDTFQVNRPPFINFLVSQRRKVCGSWKGNRSFETTWHFLRNAVLSECVRAEWASAGLFRLMPLALPATWLNLLSLIPSHRLGQESLLSCDL